MNPIGINMHAMVGLTDEEYLDAVAERGFHNVFAGPWEHDRLADLARAASARKLTIETLHAPFRGINSIWHNGEEGEAMLKELTDCIDGCVVAGAGIAVVHLSSGEDAPPVTDIGRKRFEQLVTYANARGVKIAFENQRKLASLAWALETFSESQAGFCWDIGHEACFTPGRAYMPLFGDRILCTHTQDNLCEYNRDLHLIPFDGKVRFDRVTEQLKRVEYRGSITLEVIQRNSDRYDGWSVYDYLDRAAAAAKRIAVMMQQTV